MKFTYKHTRYACYLAYITGAVINNFAPLLFIIFQKEYGISLVELSVVISANFGVQLIVDFLCSKYVNKIGYRNTLIIALIMAFLGLVFLGILPRIMPAFIGIIISVIFYAIGSGMLEVMVSPTIEALPGEAKTSDMSILHSFYCWGSMLVIIVSTLFFKVFGLSNWTWLCLMWALLPLVTTLLFTKVPIIPFGEEAGEVPYRKIFSNRMFLVFVLIMLCAGASELSMSQWASLFAETGLGVSKAVGDLLGPCMFALFMGIARLLFGKYGERVDTFNVLSISSFICVIGYIVSVFSKNPIISLFGCALVGFGSAVMWPGTLSLAAKHCSFAGIALFGLLAMSGDIGCCVGPTLVGQISSKISIFDSSLKAGILFAIVFPIILMVCVNALKTRLTDKD